MKEPKDMSDLEFLRRRADSAEGNKHFSPVDALRLALADLEEGIVQATGVVIYLADIREDGSAVYHAYRGNLTRNEEVILLEFEKMRALDRWRIWHEGELD